MPWPFRIYIHQAVSGPRGSGVLPRSGLNEARCFHEWGTTTGSQRLGRAHVGTGSTGGNSIAASSMAVEVGSGTRRTAPSMSSCKVDPTLSVRGHQDDGNDSHSHRCLGPYSNLQHRSLSDSATWLRDSIPPPRFKQPLSGSTQS